MSKKNPNTQGLTWHQAITDYVPETDTVECGNLTFTVRELSGSERFEAQKRADGDQWILLCWLAFTGLTSPTPPDLAAMNLINPEYVSKIAKTVMALSGMAESSRSEAENESAEVVDIGIS
jgi:hypothetical protein